MPTRPEAHVEELERLAAKYPSIPMLRNHLAGALEASGRRERAERIIAETARQFPTYVFGVCNYAMMLIADGKIDEARALIENGPRGPVFSLTDFYPARDTFHISEAVSHAAMVGHYMIATGRREAAKVQLKILEETAPESGQCRSLRRAMDRDQTALALSAAARRLKADLEQRAERRAAKHAKVKAADASGTPAIKPQGNGEGPRDAASSNNRASKPGRRADSSGDPQLFDA